MHKLRFNNQLPKCSHEGVNNLSVAPKIKPKPNPITNYPRPHSFYVLIWKIGSVNFYSDGISNIGKHNYQTSVRVYRGSNEVWGVSEPGPTFNTLFGIKMVLQYVNHIGWANGLDNIGLFYDHSLGGFYLCVYNILNNIPGSLSLDCLFWGSKALSTNRLHFIIHKNSQYKN